MDYETARANMIEQQIRPWNVLEMQTLNALGEVRREDFVPEEYRHLTFVDTQIPISPDQVMLEPKVSARLIEALDLQPDHHLLEIGTGTGYSSALAALICRQVTSLEIDPALSSQAGRNLAMAGIENVRLICDDCFNYCNNQTDTAKFDKILITGSMATIDPMFFDMLNEKGTIVGIEGVDPAMQATVISKQSDKTTLFETSVPRLVNAQDKPSFEF